MLFQSESDKIIKQIQRGAGVVDSEDLLELLKKGRRSRGVEYEKKSIGIAKRFNGKQQEFLLEALQKRYPRTYQNMPIDPVNWIKFFAIQDSGVYEQAPKRYLMHGDTKVSEDDERHVAFREALEQISINSKMKTMERRCASGTYSSIIAMALRRINGKEKLVAHVYWPHDVVCIAHPNAPDDVEALYFVALKQNEHHEGSSVWQVWTRSFNNDEFDLSFGSWSYRMISEDGKYTSPVEEYAGELLPIAFLFTEDRQGFWPDLNDDIIVNVDNLNIARSNRQHVIDMQAHSQRVYKGVTRETSEIESGPDSIMQISPNEDFDVIPMNANHDAIEASATRDLQELGVSRGNSPDAYSVKPIATQSGIAKVIANSPHDQRIEDQKAFFVDFEQNQMLPIVLDILQNISVISPDFSGVIPKIDMAPRKVFEDDKILADRVQIMRNMKIIDRAEARVLMKLSKDYPTALAEIERADIDNKKVADLERITTDEPIERTDNSPDNSSTQFDD